MRAFVVADWLELDQLTVAFANHPHSVLRGHETGLIMMRGRMGGTGAQCNFGEASVTRCTVRLSDGTEGHAYLTGRNAAHTHRAALCDALLQAGEVQLNHVANTLEASIAKRQHTAAAKAATTKVDFFTMVRGDV